MATTTDPAQLMKQQVAKAAVDLVQSGMVVGLGSGSTAALAIQYLGEKLQSGAISNIRGVPTSFQATVLARDYQIPLVTLDEIETIDVAIDGADEVDPHHNLIKGGGAAHMREKIVDSLAQDFIVVVDSSKLSSRLGTLFKVPVEVLPMALTPVTRAIKALGGEPELRMGVKKAGPVVTDQGNLVLDVKFANITDAVSLEMELNNIPGVLENGIFVGSVVSKVLVGEVKDGEPSVRELPKS